MAYFLINPASGNYSVGRVSRTIQNLEQTCQTVHTLEVRSPADVQRCCIAINQQADPALIVVAAGDGTINAVVNSINPGKATVAILPFGTSNVFAAEIGISSIDDGLARIVRGETRPLSLGEISYQGRSQRFILMAGLGFDGAVARDVKPSLKHRIKQGAFALSALTNAAKWDSSMCEVRTQTERVSCHSVVLCNAARYAGNFTLAPGCSPFSPGITACCITESSRLTYARMALDLFRGAPVIRGVRYITADEFEISGNKPIQLDGDFVGYGPAKVTVLPDFFRIIV